MSRAIWFIAGAGAGVYAMIRGRQAAEVLTADGLRDRAQAIGVGARIFVEELAQGRVEKEAEVREWIAERTEGPKPIGSDGAAEPTLELQQHKQRQSSRHSMEGTH